MWWDGLAADRAFLYCFDMPARWKSDRPMSRQVFEALFADDAACARYLAGRRWPGDGGRTGSSARFAGLAKAGH